MNADSTIHKWQLHINTFFSAQQCLTQQFYFEALHNKKVKPDWLNGEQKHCLKITDLERLTFQILACSGSLSFKSWFYTNRFQFLAILYIDSPQWVMIWTLYPLLSLLHPLESPYALQSPVCFHVKLPNPTFQIIFFSPFFWYIEIRRTITITKAKYDLKHRYAPGV